MSEAIRITLPDGPTCTVAPPAVIEGFGTPGCGKTFTTARLVEQLRRDRMDPSAVTLELGGRGRASQVLAKIRFALRGGAFRHSRFLPIARLVIHHRPISLSAGLRVLFNWFYVTGLIQCESRRSALVVLDQGICQALWSTVFWSSHPASVSESAALVRRLLDSLDIGSVLVMHVSAEDNVILERLRRRTGGASPLDRDPGRLSEALSATRSTTAILNLLAGSDRFNLAQVANGSGKLPHPSNGTELDGVDHV